MERQKHQVLGSANWRRCFAYLLTVTSFFHADFASHAEKNL